MSKSDFKNKLQKEQIDGNAFSVSDSITKQPTKGPISFFSGALTSCLLSWICFLVSKKIVYYFINHDIDYNSPIAQSIASGFKTLIIGISFLATFSFGFIGLGLILVFIRSLFDVKNRDND